MTIVFIDYTALYYTEVAKTAIPPVIKGKFVQLRNESVFYLVFSPSEFTKYHADIVQRFCLDRGIEGSFDPEKKRYAIHDQSWTILGGGKFELDRNKKAIKLYNNSMAYGKFLTFGLKETMNAFPEFSGFTVLVE